MKPPHTEPLAPTAAAPGDEGQERAARRVEARHARETRPLALRLRSGSFAWMSLHPLQSFQHTLREISVNRASPCELVRELVSNAYDAAASEVVVIPLMQKRGLLFFDNGTGLSASEADRRNDVVPYVAFFSIGKGTKIPGQQIGYKCQGSKLCFASRRFALITRCRGEASYRWKVIENPKQTLDLDYDISPKETSTPWAILREELFPDADERTSSVLRVLGESFFRSRFEHGTLIIVEDFETDAYDSYFSAEEPKYNYLLNYIRYYTAHGDVRRIGREQGFSARDVSAFKGLLKGSHPVNLTFWVANRHSEGALEPIPQGWKYLPPPDEKTESPAVVHQLRNGRFSARHATTFKHADRHYGVILAIDGNRRALEGYEELGRRGSKRSGITISDLRGVLLASNGIVVSPYKQLLDHPLLERDWRILQEGSEHYVLVIDGNFELVTNRDAVAPSSLSVLRDQEFVAHIHRFLQLVQQSKEGEVFAQLIERLNRETTRHQENQYIENNSRLKRELVQRESFTVKGIPTLEGRPFFAPETGEEHFVGALYTLFSHLVDPKGEVAAFWKRPVTFAGLGIDALAVEDERRGYENGNLLSVEYKRAFDSAVEFNHPLNITDRIVCWEMVPPSIGQAVRDAYSYQGVVKEKLLFAGREVGFVLGEIQHVRELRSLSHEVTVLDLRALLEVTFAATFRPGAKASKAVGRMKRR